MPSRTTPRKQSGRGAKLLAECGVRKRQNRSLASDRWAAEVCPKEELGPDSTGSESMFSRLGGLCLIAVVALLPGCNNTLNPLCGSARPVPEIGSLSPSTVSFAQVQQGMTLIIKGGQFVASSQAVVDGKVLSATVSSSEQMKVTLTTGVISGPGAIKVSVHTPSGGSADVGCSSGGDSTSLMLTVN